MSRHQTNKEVLKYRLKTLNSKHLKDTDTITGIVVKDFRNTLTLAMNSANVEKIPPSILLTKLLRVNTLDSGAYSWSRRT